MYQQVLASAFAASVSMVPTAGFAQDWDKMRLSDARLNSAANYTDVLRTAHAEVERYITWRGWETSLSAAEQKARTAAILKDIETSETVSATLVPTLVRATLDSYAVRFRYCDGKLLSYFGTPDFKHNFSATQIAEAPVLRAQRQGRQYTGRRIGTLRADPPEMTLKLANGGRQVDIPDCLINGIYGNLPDGVAVAYISDAPEKFGVAHVRRKRETQTRACPNGKVGQGRTQTRYLRTDYSAQWVQEGTPYYDTAAGGDGNWVVTADYCRDPVTIRKRDVRACDAVIRGATRTITMPGRGRAVYDYFLTEAQDPTDVTRVVWLPSDADGNYTATAVGTLSPLSNCDDLTTTSTITPTVRTTTELQTHACGSGWTHGNRSYRRTVTTITYRYSGASPGWQSGLSASEVNVVRHGAWSLTSNNCHVWRSSTRRETRRTTCSCNGFENYERTVTTAGWDFEAHADQISTTYSNWRHVSGKCEPAWKIERQGGACRNNSSWSNSGGGGREGQEDNDRDGVYDGQDADDGNASVGHGRGSSNGGDGGRTSWR
ncbi:hypothetical protein [Ruegeria atlantica]|uniref:hypothetical protein n=1 Tax=Ruegeria atlantica TaxID=81569 RepID=UPI0020C4216C|nr:hypothetical protein [Ruegeria atlantica]